MRARIYIYVISDYKRGNVFSFYIYSKGKALGLVYAISLISREEEK